MDIAIDSADRFLQRAELLFDVHRYQDAEAELRQAAAQEPNDVRVHMWLALVLARQYSKQLASTRQEPSYKLDEALKEAKIAVGLSPDFAFPHAILGLVLLELDRPEQALRSIQEALRLAPDFPLFFGLLARVYVPSREWPLVLQAAEAGLRLDPQDVDCINLRFMALVQLGRQAEAGQAIEQALAREPANAATHANLGWLMLHRNQPQEAMRHYREALRLDPLAEWARFGIVEAMKARFFLYRLLLSFDLWLSRLSKAQARALDHWIKVALRALRILSRAFPPLLFVALPLFLFYFFFVLAAWTADLFFNLLLRFDRLGRAALLEEEITASNWAAICLAVATLCGAAGLILQNWGLVAGAVEAGMMLMPIAAIFRAKRGRWRNVLIAGAIALALIGLLGMLAAIPNMSWVFALVVAFVIAWFIYWWLAGQIDN